MLSWAATRAVRVPLHDELMTKAFMHAKAATLLQQSFLGSVSLWSVFKGEHL